MTQASVEPSTIIDFWLGDAPNGPESALARRDVWYDGGPELDAEIIDRFGEAVDLACGDGFEAWEHEPLGSLALIILLDQFTRNIFRGTKAAYAGDERAWRVADAAVRKGFDKQLSVPGQVFLYHPFHHAESLEEQVF